MENKKLLRYILKDLSELEEMFAGKECLQFDEIETEFIQNRVISARKLVQLYIGHHEESREILQNEKPEPVVETPTHQTVFAEPKHQKVEAEKTETPVVAELISAPSVAPKIEKTLITDPVKPAEKQKEIEKIAEHHQPKGVIVNEILGYFEETITEIAKEDGGKIPEAEEEDEWRQPEPEKVEQASQPEIIQQEIQLEEEPVDEQANKRLGDSFSKEKSVNDLVSTETQNLENKISNLPVSSIQAAIGINDRFQYIRELFDGNTDRYNDTVSKLDSMADLKEAVVFLQQNFKWKKTEVSLKFVTLIKRRFPQ